ncbi:MAG: hypothetical protein H6774_04795 [Pseudomonadales bacterium]|nr:hypothetical protein [Candidatus Woesebacteria bacterium]MCB9802368.1 hypothetical protein [Pseudomonadales bacterium]
MSVPALITSDQLFSHPVFAIGTPAKELSKLIERQLPVAPCAVIPAQTVSSVENKALPSSLQTQLFHWYEQQVKNGVCAVSLSTRESPQRQHVQVVKGDSAMLGVITQRIAAQDKDDAPVAVLIQSLPANSAGLKSYSHHQGARSKTEVVISYTNQGKTADAIVVDTQSGHVAHAKEQVLPCNPDQLQKIAHYTKRIKQLFIHEIEVSWAITKQDVLCIEVVPFEPETQVLRTKTKLYTVLKLRDSLTKLTSTQTGIMLAHPNCQAHISNARAHERLSAFSRLCQQLPSGECVYTSLLDHTTPVETLSKIITTEHEALQALGTSLPHTIVYALPSKALPAWHTVVKKDTPGYTLWRSITAPADCLMGNHNEEESAAQGALVDAHALSLHAHGLRPGDHHTTDSEVVERLLDLLQMTRKPNAIVLSMAEPQPELLSYSVRNKLAGVVVPDEALAFTSTLLKHEEERQ